MIMLEVGLAAAATTTITIAAAAAAFGAAAIDDPEDPLTPYLRRFAGRRWNDGER